MTTVDNPITPQDVPQWPPEILKPQPCLPVGLQPMSGPMAWEGKDFAQENAFIFELTATELEEVKLDERGQRQQQHMRLSATTLFQPPETRLIDSFPWNALRPYFVRKCHQISGRSSFPWYPPNPPYPPTEWIAQFIKTCIGIFEKNAEMGFANAAGTTNSSAVVAGKTTKPGNISFDTFPLPTLGSKLRNLSYLLHHGQGFFVLRGLEPFRFTRLENTLIYIGISSWIGNKRGLQCVDGPVMTHIFDYSMEVEKNEQRNDGYLGHANRTSFLPFHTDDGHLISLYCLQSANIGGRTLLASSWAIYNRLLSERPDVIHTLKEQWTWDSFRKDDPSFQRQLLMEKDGKLICNYRIRPFLGTPGYPRNADLGPLPPYQEEALDVVSKIAHEIALTVELRTGDLQFFNNLSILHAREEFDRSSEETVRRHLLRMVHKDDEYAWQLPEDLEKAMKEMYEHDPAEEKFVWSPQPLPYLIGQ